jgi:hypothetical protein
MEAEINQGSFEWALAKMRDGYKVRRPFFMGWSYDDARGVLLDGQGLTLLHLEVEDVLAMDWELADG